MLKSVYLYLKNAYIFTHSSTPIRTLTRDNDEKNRLKPFNFLEKKQIIKVGDFHLKGSKHTRHLNFQRLSLFRILLKGIWNMRISPLLETSLKWEEFSRNTWTNLFIGTGSLRWRLPFVWRSQDSFYLCPITLPHFPNRKSHPRHSILALNFNLV